MKRKSIVLLLACLMLMTLFSACGDSGANSNANGTNPAASPDAAGQNDSEHGAELTEDGRDADGNIVDSSAYAISLGLQWFTEEDLEIWENIEEPSDNPDKILIRWGALGRSFDESPNLRGDKRMLIEIKKSLGDRVEIQIYFNAALGGSPDQICGGLQSKSFEGYSFNVGGLYEYTRAFTPLDFGFLIPDLEAGIEVCAPDSEPAKIMKQRCLEDTGLYVLTMSPVGMRHLTNDTRQINTLDDLKGLKIRVQSNNVHMALFEALGASPTPIAYSELFTAMQQHTVDGQENPVCNIFESNYAEVQKYMTLSNHLYTAACGIINYEWLTGLPEDAQEIILEAARAGQEQAGKDLLNCEAEMLKYLETRMEVNSLPDEEVARFKEIAMSTWDMAPEIMGGEYWEQVLTAIEEVIANM